MSASTSTGGCVGAPSRLCSLVHEFLPPFPDLHLVALTLDQDRSLLISLSQVLNKIRHWINELESQEQGGVSAICNSHSTEHECLTCTVSNLISLLNMKNKYVHHLVANIFLAISEFLLDYVCSLSSCYEQYFVVLLVIGPIAVVLQGSDWDGFIHLLCFCLDFALCNTLAHSVPPSIRGVENPKSVLFDTSLIKSRLDKSTWNTVAGILGILRGIVKLLKGEDDEHVGVLWNGLSKSLLKLPWDMLNVRHDNSNTEDGACSGENVSPLMNDGDTLHKILFLGNLVQILCSVVGISGFSEAYKFAISNGSCELVPRLLHWCLAKERISRYRHILPYFQHKNLMLMIRLSFFMQLDCSILVQWLEFLHKYYQDLLWKPMSQLASHQDDILEGSPFLFTLYDQDIDHLSSHHLQRLAVFLFLRCSFSLIGLTKLTADLRCTCTRPDLLLASDLNTVKDCCAEKKGRLEIHGWLQRQCPLIMFSNNEMYMDNCIKFASSFIRLYMHEDDMLFQALLQMLTIPLWAERQCLQGERICEEAEEDILYHISNLFKPLLLFHVFLAELQYDHQVLLDFLISKDTGSKCAEYLLRCLRMVCDSWTLFVEISFEESKCSDNASVQFGDAKACLLSLRSSLKKLHRRKLFSYNPEVLIRRLTRFEELCNQNA